MEQQMKLDNDFYRSEFLQDRHVVGQFDEIKKMEQVCAELNFDILQTHFNFSHGKIDFKDVTGNFLILSDRLDQMAHRLGSFISEKTCGHVLGTISNEAELEEQMLNADYLIIVGYLEDELNFKVLNEVRTKNNQLNVIFYATYSPITSRQMSKYGIYCIFERHEPLGSFLRLF